ncbi:MAG TPA: hypothetical protein PLQ40_01730 [Ferruginibacter sp.]|nr:hypothetical protein [Ferruginibacter sp.]
MPKQTKTFYITLSLIIVMLALSIPLLISHFNGKFFDKAIRNNSSFTIGVVYDYRQKAKFTPAIKYQFDYGGKTYFSYSSSSNSRLFNWEDPYKLLFNHIKGKSFPVVLSKDNISKYNKILIIPDDFKEFNLQYPDSLNWVKSILNRD